LRSLATSGEVRVEKQLHAAGATCQLALLCSDGCVFERGEDILAFQARIRLGSTVIRSWAMSQGYLAVCPIPP